MIKQALLFTASLAACTHDASEPLDLEVDAPDHLAGTFAHDGARLRFEFSRDGSTHTGILSTAEGNHLVSSVLTPEREVMEILGGRLVISGAPGALVPDKIGDESALTELDQIPELAVFEDLRVELAERGYDRDLYHQDIEVEQVSSAHYNSGDGYWHFYPGEAISFGTKGFWATTTVRLRNFTTTCGSVKLQVGIPYQQVRVPGIYENAGRTSVSGQWWAVPVWLTNLNAWINWGSGGICKPGELGAFTQ